MFLSKDRHPSLHWGGEALWGTLHDVRHEDQTAGMEATDLRFALWPQFLLTARHHAARSAMAVKDQAEKGATFEDSAALFESLLVAAADFDRRGHARDRRTSWIRSKTAFCRTPSGRKRSASAVAKRHFSPGATGSGRSQRAGATRTKPRRERPSGVSRPGLEGAAAGRCFRADLHLQAERARLLQEEMAAQLATATNRNLFALTVVTTVLLPPAFVTGLFRHEYERAAVRRLGLRNGLRDHSLPARGGRRLSANPSLPGGLLKRLRPASFAQRLRAVSGASPHLKPGSHSGCAMFGDCRFERPFARVVGDERDMGAAAGLDEDGVAPIGLPAVVHRVKKPRDVAPEPHCLNDRRFVGERKHAGWPRGIT